MVSIAATTSVVMPISTTTVAIELPRLTMIFRSAVVGIFTKMFATVVVERVVLTEILMSRRTVATVAAVGTTPAGASVSTVLAVRAAVPGLELALGSAAVEGVEVEIAVFDFVVVGCVDVGEVCDFGKGSHAERFETGGGGFSG